MQEAKFKLDSDAPVSSNAIEQIPHITKIQIPKDVDENTKKFWVNYNLMQKTLIDNGLMELK